MRIGYAALASAPLFAVLMAGCASSSGGPPPASAPSSVKVDRSSFTAFEKSLLSSVKKMEHSYSRYVKALEELKRKRKLPYTRIPRGMGKRLDVRFDGYLLALVRSVLAEAGYDMKLGMGLSITDSPVVSRDYTKTRIVDILEDCGDYGGYEFVIDEKERLVSVFPEEK